MVQFHILSGKKAGTEWMARRFPFGVGRSSPAELILDDNGVWDRHLQVDLRRDEGVVLEGAPEALVSINGNRVANAVLRNGDIIELGSVKLRFSLSPTRQRSLRIREVLTWIALGLLCVAQVTLIYWLIS